MHTVYAVTPALHFKNNGLFVTQISQDQVTSLQDMNRPTGN